MTRTKHAFTMIELLLAVTISGIFLSMAGRALVEYIGVYQDMVAETYLTSFAQQLKQRIENGYPDGGLREAVGQTIAINQSEDNEIESIEYKTYSNVDSAAHGAYTDPTVVSTTKLLKTAADQYAIEYNGTASNAGRGKLQVVDMSAELIHGSEPRNAPINILHSQEQLLSVSYTIRYLRADKSYSYRLRMNVPVMN